MPPRNRRTGRNRGGYLRKGHSAGLVALEQALLAIADAQATLNLSDTALETGAGIHRGALARLRQGRGFATYIERITDYLESKLT